MYGPRMEIQAKTSSPKAPPATATTLARPHDAFLKLAAAEARRTLKVGVVDCSAAKPALSQSAILLLVALIIAIPNFFGSVTE